MSRGPKITDEIIKIIADVYVEHPNWKSEKIRLEVDKKLHQTNPNLNKGFPSISAVQKAMVKIRRKAPLTKEEGPWGLDTMDNIPPEALPTVLEAWAYSREKLKEEFTIRQAKWVARLYKIYEIGDRTDKIVKLVKEADECAKIELTSKLTEEGFNHPIYIFNLYQELLEQQNKPSIPDDSTILSLLLEDKENTYLKEAMRAYKKSRHLKTIPKIGEQ